jgi:hypothetical protein
MAHGRVAVIAGRDGAIRRFELPRGQILSPTVLARGEVLAVALSPDGRHVLAGCADGAARLWDLSGSSRPLGPPVVHGSPVRGVFFEPGGKWFLTTGSDGTTRRWPVPRPGEDLTPEDHARQVQVLTGEIIDGTGDLCLLPAAEWQRRRAGLLIPPMPGAEDWHDARARDAEQDGDLFAARWHLDALLLLRPKDRRLYARRSLVHARASDFTQAGADLDRAAKTADANRVVYLENALATCQSARAWQAALWCLDRLLEEKPHDERFEQERALALKQAPIK